MIAAPNSAVCPHEMKRSLVAFAMTLTFILFIATSLTGVGVAAAQGLGGGTLPTLLPINVESVEIDGMYFLNGAPFGTDYFDGGRIEIEAEDLETTVIGNSWTQDFGPIQLIKGRYTPLFTSLFDPATAPRSSGQAISEPIVFDTDQAWDPDVPSVPVQFIFSLNGSSFPVSATDSAEFYLRDTRSGREIPIGTIADTSTSLNIVPGTYDVIYAYQSGALIPENEHAAILSDVTIDAATSLVVDVPLVLRSFFPLLNGVAFPTSPLSHGNLSLENEETGDVVFIGPSYSPQFLRLIPGEYRLIYEAREFNGIAPRNLRAVAQESLTILPTGLTSVFMNVTAHLVEPEYFFNGAAASTSGLEYGEIYIQDSVGNRQRLGRTNQTGEAFWYIGGTYDFYYEFREGAAALPFNREARFAEGVVINASGPVTLDIQSSMTSLTADLNGEAFPASGLQNGYMYLVKSETGQEYFVGATNAPLSPTHLVHGAYDIVYRFREGGVEVPINSRHVVARELVHDQQSSFLVDIQAQLMSPRFSLNGSPFPATASNYGSLFLRDADGDSISLGDSYAPNNDRMVIEGAYAANYEWQAGTEVPQNRLKTVQFVSVPEAGFGLGLVWGALLLACAGVGVGASNRKAHAGNSPGKMLERAETWVGTR